MPTTVGRLLFTAFIRLTDNTSQVHDQSRSMFTQTEETKVSKASSAALNGTTVQFGSTFKSTPTQFVPFNQEFSAAPIVVCSPYWPNGAYVSTVETITSIEPNGFVVTSNNSAEAINGQPYFINWIAIQPQIAE
jgi:hypothetical protein